LGFLAIFGHWPFTALCKERTANNSIFVRFCQDNIHNLAVSLYLSCIFSAYLTIGVWISEE
jgi:hypothetical protein